MKNAFCHHAKYQDIISTQSFKLFTLNKRLSWVGERNEVKGRFDFIIAGCKAVDRVAQGLGLKSCRRSICFTRQFHLRAWASGELFVKLYHNWLPCKLMCNLINQTFSTSFHNLAVSCDARVNTTLPPTTQSLFCWQHRRILEHEL